MRARARERSESTSSTLRGMALDAPRDFEIVCDVAAMIPWSWRTPVGCTLHRVGTLP
jgi:hypothetical protein